MNIKIKGSMGAPAYKTMPIHGMKSTVEGGYLTISGYANTKNHPDRYGDIPAVYAPKRSYVYDLTQFLKNPVLLIDHNNSAMAIAGKVVECAEDEKGLFFKAILCDSDYPAMAHIRRLVEQGMLRAISIAGRFYFENEENPNQLTLADIYEISLVAVPADPDSAAEVENGSEEKSKDAEIVAALERLKNLMEAK